MATEKTTNFNIALVDMDGTLFDYRFALMKEMHELFGDDNIPGEKTSFYKKAERLIKCQDGFWRNLPKIELGFEIVRMLKVAGFRIHILTKGPYNTTSAWTEKVDCIRMHLPDTSMTITEDKGLVYGKILVDDWPDYCEDWLKWRPRGVVIMPSYKYNEGFENKYPGRVLKVNNNNLYSVLNRSTIDKILNRSPKEDFAI